jgi:hypothetical protein
MRYASLLCVLFAGFVWQTAPSSRAQDQPSDQRKRIQQYITDLGSPKFKERERARVELEKIGVHALEAVQKATESDDPQVRRMASDLLKDLGTVMLPTPLEDVAIAASGQVLVLKLRNQKGLTLYDARTRKLKTLELPTSDFTFGAGGNVVVVFLKESVELRSYNLTTLEQICSRDFVDSVVILQIIMGHSRDDLALLRVAHETEGESPTCNRLLDVTTLKLQRPANRKENQGYNTKYSEKAQFRATGNMSRLAEWSTSYDPSGIYLFTRSREGYQVHGKQTASGHLAMGDDGKIYTGHGHIVDLKEGEDRKREGVDSTGQIAGQSLFPGIGGLFFLGLKVDGSLDFYQTGTTTPLCSLDPFPRWMLPLDERREKAPDPKQSPGMVEKVDKGSVTLDRRIVFVPAAGHLIFLPHSNDRLIHRKFDLKASLDRTGKDYLHVVSSPPLWSKAGARWNYRIATVQKHSPVVFKLEKAPEGMSLSPEGQMTWTVPNGIQGTAEVKVAITDSKSHVFRHSFTIAFE